MRICLCVSIALTFLVMTCGKTPVSQPGTFRVFKQSDIITLDPVASNDVASGEVCALIYDGLVQFNDSLQVIPCLASHWEISPDRKTYTFYIKKNARFSHGRLVTAADIRYSFERVLAPEGRSSRTWLLAPVEGALDYYNKRTQRVSGIITPNDTTVILHLTKPNYLILSFLAMPAAVIVPQEVVAEHGKDFGRHPVGTGPWQLVEWLQNDRLVLVPNPHYHGTKPLLKKVVYRIIPEIMTATGEFEVGNLDMMKIPDAEYERWINDTERKEYILTQDKLAVCYIGLNNQKKPFTDVRVRQALNYALDIETITHALLKDRGRVAHGSVPPLLLGEADSLKATYQYNPKKAKRLLAEAGYAQGFTMEIWQKHNPEAARILETVQAYLGQVGITVQLVTRDWASLKQAVNKGEPDAFYLDWYADYPDAENFLYPLFHSSQWGGAGNRARYASTRVDSLFEVARNQPHASQRTAVYRRINSIVYNDAPWIFLYHPKTYVVHQPWLQGFTLPAIYNGNKLLHVTTVQ